MNRRGFLKSATAALAAAALPPTPSFEVIEEAVVESQSKRGFDEAVLKDALRELMPKMNEIFVKYNPLFDKLLRR